MSSKAPRLRRGSKIPKRLDPSALTLRWTPDGTTASQSLDLSGWVAGQVMRQEALSAFGRLTADDGDWRSPGTVATHLRRVRRLVEWCGAHGVDSFADLDMECLSAYLDDLGGRISTKSFFHHRGTLRVFLVSVPERSNTLRMWLNERWGSAPEGEAPLDYYTRAEFAAIEQAAVATVSRARSRVQRFAAHIQRIEDNDTQGRKDEVRASLWAGVAPTTKTRKYWLGDPSPAAGAVMWSHFFTLTPDEVVAAAVLLVCRNGWNLSPLLKMSVGSTMAGTGEDQGIFVVDLDKARRGARRHSQLVLVDDGLASDGAAWIQVVEATQPGRDWLRSQGVVTDDLLVFSSQAKASDGGHRGSRTLCGPVRHGLPRDALRSRPSWVPDGLSIDFPALRRTHQTLIRRQPNQNTLSTHIERYLAANPEVRAEIDQDIAEGQAERLRRAEETVTLRVSDLSEVAPEVADGSLDTATAACRNIDLHPLTGEPCTDSFFACLRCRNAVATERHLPRLALLHKALEDRRTTMSEGGWERWRDDYVALTVFLFHSARLSPDAYRQHLASASGADAENVRALLNGDLDATV